MKVIDGYVSTEIDARLSYDTDVTVARGLRFLEIYKELSCDPTRVLLKIASTYEGLQAAKILEAKGIKCNCTLLFNKAQAVVAADGGAFLISPFVGRITDYYMKKEQRTAWFDVDVDPGVVSVRDIYKYYKQHNISTVVMGASFRHKVRCCMCIYYC
jgi:transaldolase